MGKETFEKDYLALPITTEILVSDSVNVQQRCSCISGAKWKL